MSMAWCDALRVEYDLKISENLKILIKEVRSKDIINILQSVYINNKKKVFLNLIDSAFICALKPKKQQVLNK